MYEFKAILTAFRLKKACLFYLLQVINVLKKHVLWAEDDVISAESTIFAADFLTSSADFQRKSNVPG